MDYKAGISTQVKEASKEVEALKKSKDVDGCKALEKKLRKLYGSLDVGGFSKEAKLCQEIERFVVVKIKNFHHGELNDDWFKKVDGTIAQIGEQFLMSDDKKRKRRIVLIDDDDDLLKILEAEFHAMGFECVKFQTGKEGREFLLQEGNLKDVFLLVLDRVLPDMDGLDVLREYNKVSKERVPTLILSALAQESEVLEGLQEGAVDYVTKPFSVFMLMQKSLNLLKVKEG